MNNQPEKRSLFCRVFGHDYCDDAEMYRFYECRRCGFVEHDAPGIVVRLKGRCRLWIKDKFESVRIWWICPDCGRHFGLHDEREDHFPF